MKVIIDREKLHRRAMASHAASLGGLVAMLASVALNLFRPQWAALAAVLLVLGFTVSTVGIYFANRWVKKPRPEDALDRALKGLDDRFRLYHYLPGAPDHVLLTPGGLVTLETRAGEGSFQFAGGKWSQKITLGKAIRFFLEEPLGNPTAEAQGMASRFETTLARRLPGVGPIPVRPIVVFTHPDVVLQRKDPPIPVCQTKQLRPAIPKDLAPLSREDYQAVSDLLEAGGPF